MKLHRKIELILIASIVLLGAVLRYQRRGWDSISMDEMWHLALSSGRGSPQITLPRNQLIEDLPSVTELRGAPAWWRIPLNCGQDTHPPLHYLFLRAWREVFGSGDLAAQWSTVAVSLASIVLIWLAARTSFDPPVGLWSAALMAAAPTQVFMAQEIRSYTLLTALGCWALWVAARIEKSGVTRGRLIELALAVAAMMLTHYFALGACMAIGVFLLIRLRGRARLHACGALLTTAAVYLLVWGPLMLPQLSFAAQAGQGFLAETSDRATVLAMIRFALLPLRLVAEMPFASAIWIAAGAIAYAVPCLLVDRNNKLLLWLLWLAGAAGLLLMLDLTRSTRHLSYIRYGLLASPAVYVLFVASLSMLKPPIFHAVSAVIVGVALYLSPSAYVSDAPGYEVLHAALHEGVEGDAVLVFYAGASSELHMEALFLAAGRQRSIWPRAIVLLTQPADASLQSALVGKDVVVLSGPAGEIGSIIPGASERDRIEIVDGQDRHIATMRRARVR